MSKTAKQMKHLFNLAIGTLITGFIFALGASMGVTFFLKIESLL